MALPPNSSKSSRIISRGALAAKKPRRNERGSHFPQLLEQLRNSNAKGNSLCHFAGSYVQCAPPPAFSITAAGSIVQLRFDTASKIEPAAPSDGTPASASVA